MTKMRSKMEDYIVDDGFPIITPWELSVGMETRVPILPAFKPNAGNPPPQDASDKDYKESMMGYRPR